MVLFGTKRAKVGWLRIFLTALALLGGIYASRQRFACDAPATSVILRKLVANAEVLEGGHKPVGDVFVEAYRHS